MFTRCHTVTVNAAQREELVDQRNVSSSCRFQGLGRSEGRVWSCKRTMFCLWHSSSDPQTWIWTLPYYRVWKVICVIRFWTLNVGILYFDFSFCFFCCCFFLGGVNTKWSAWNSFLPDFLFRIYFSLWFKFIGNQCVSKFKGLIRQVYSFWQFPCGLPFHRNHCDRKMNHVDRERLQKYNQLKMQMSLVKRALS